MGGTAFFTRGYRAELGGEREDLRPSVFACEYFVTNGIDITANMELPSFLELPTLSYYQSSLTGIQNGAQSHYLGLQFDSMAP